MAAQIANLANVVEHAEREHGLSASLDTARRYAGTACDPRVADAWCAAAGELVEGLSEASSWDMVVAAEPGGRPPLDEAEFEAALELVGDYADLKSPFFAGHSRGVAALATAAARRAGFPASELRKLRHAALVHDIGRNGVANSIWDKPGPLDVAELERVRLHAYYTERVLQRATQLHELASISAAAHERSGGSGYPHGRTAGSLTMLSRFLAAADVYHAMSEVRPHRQALTSGAAASELRRAVRAGELDGTAVDAVLAVAGHGLRRKPSTPAGLTAREVEVLVLAARGASLKGIAGTLGIAPKTAGNHVERIYSKLQVSTRAEAAMFAMRHGLMSSEPET